MNAEIEESIEYDEDDGEITTTTSGATKTTDKTWIENIEKKREDQQDLLNDFYAKKPQYFIDFLKSNNIPLDSYNIKDLPRFIRLKSLSDSLNQSLLAEIENQLKTKLVKIHWLPGFYKLQDSSVSISSSKAYKDGLIYGMDASSGAAILALDPKPGDNILDICCAPGTKLCMISDLMNGQGSLTGVDISRPRLGICKTLLNKYKIPNIRLFLCDGTAFNIKAPNPNDSIPLEILEKGKELKRIKLDKKCKEKKEQQELNDEDNENEKDKENNIKPLETSTTNNNNNNNTDIIDLKRKQQHYKSKKPLKKRLIDLEDLFYCKTFYMRHSNSQLYDKVIVDAECSLDASVRHLINYSKMGRHMVPEEFKKLTDLQKLLIQNGFNLLKEGGHIVYSTCSFCKEQNEDVVQWLLDNNPNAKLIPSFNNTTSIVEQDNNMSLSMDQLYNSETVPFSTGFIENTYRFYPKNGTSGMFISKIQKIKL
ncbi:hypothetical protein CYY_007263 [Polysphondylium violaceum]|uniref:SAM-dependent MTase RsmB/NOP-type domain-containing protein n=1 Tax=Polysphondylium violaceum TaxID=133409 RepID=A0A8J4PS40_9MYCE|nr:hypothetical protein CYY_007263 [Polysphondylium violaceum]